MTIVTFGSDDAIYGSGVYREAVYGEFGPTLVPNSVFASTSVGAFNVSGDSNLTTVGVEGSSFGGVVEANITELIGQEGGPEAAQGFAGSLQVNVSENLSSTFANTFTGNLSVSANSNLTLPGTVSNSLLGNVQNSAGASFEPTTQELSSGLGTVIIRATVGLTGQTLSSFVGNLRPNVTEFVLGLSINSSVGFVKTEAIANQNLNTLTLVAESGNTEETSTRFDFGAVKNLYDRRRTVVLPRVA